MNNIKPLMKRIGAYAIDLFLVLMLSSLISSIPALNKNMEGYQETYNKYKEEYNEYEKYIALLNESYEDKQINEEEYSKLIENETYKNIIISKYDDLKISKKEYKDIISEINKNFDLIAKDYIYILGKKGVSNSLITLICTLLYFGVLQYFLKGQTLGKKLFKLRVVSASDKKITIINYLLRSLIVNDVLLNSISIIFLLFASKKIYISVDNIIGVLVSIVEAIIIYLVLTRKDERGLHDLLFNTKVISTETTKTEEKEEIEDKKIIDAEVIEKEKTKNTRKKQTKKSTKQKDMK